MTYVGHIVGGGTHRPDPTKLEAISRLKVPGNKKQLRQALGALGFYRAYIPNYAEIAANLTRLVGTKSPNRLIWTDEEQSAFDELKHRACTSPVLISPRFGEPFLMFTDASMTSVGCCLAQLDADNHEHPVAYASHKLSATQSALSTIEREAYAVIWSLKRFRDIIFGCHITVYTDHDPLKYLRETAPKSAKLTRWSLALQEFNVTIQYKRGSRNILADALSRLNTE